MLGGGWLTAKRRGDDRLEYSVSPFYRTGFGVIAVLLLAALASAASHLFDPSNTFAYILLLCSVAAALYDESWAFSPAGVEHRFGIVGLTRLRCWPIAEVQSLRIVESKQGMGRTLLSLSLALVEGRARRIDMARGASAERLRAMAEEASRLSGIPLEG